MATCWACREWQCMYSRKVIFDESVCKAGSLTPLVVLVQSMRIMGRGRAWVSPFARHPRCFQE